jgi:hypothetical protein
MNSANLILDKDYEKFNKYVLDVDKQTDLARKTTEEAVKKRLALN